MRRPASLLTLALALSACTGPSRLVEEPVTVAIAGAPQMNAGGNAAVLLVYQLTDADPFTLVPLEEFWVGDDSALAGTLVSKREVLLYPEEVRAVPIELDDRTAFVGVAADFRAPSLDGWRAVLPVAQVRSQGLGVMVGDSTLVVTGPAGPPAETPARPVAPAGEPQQ